jgi:hypothetical protein
MTRTIHKLSSSVTASTAPKAAKASGDLSLDLTLARQLERCYVDTGVPNPPEEGLPMARVQLVLRCNAPLSKVRVAMAVEEPMALTKSTHVINSLSE